MAHNTNTAAEELLDKEFPVLDYGFVKLVDYLGSDDRIAESARVSYQAGTVQKRDNSNLIDYLMRNDHTSPFEQVVFTFHIKMPIFVARQWVRHRTARMNEISGRYSILGTDFYMPNSDVMSYQSTNNRQGRGEKLSPSDANIAFSEIEKAYQSCKNAYEKLLSIGVAREIARIVLPVATYTEIYWQIDLHNLLHFLKLRLDNHAQLEIRSYANVIKDIVSQVCPVAYSAFEKHCISSVTLSSTEAEVVKKMLKENPLFTSLTEREQRILKEKLKV